MGRLRSGGIATAFGSFRRRGERRVQVSISTRHGHLSGPTQEKIRDKITKLTRFHERITAAEITVDLGDEERPTVELQVTAERAGRFVASESAEQLLAAVDGAVHKLEHQLRKHKEKVTDHRIPGRRAAGEEEVE
jgi:putative sigma-54 modulation protein